VDLLLVALPPETLHPHLKERALELKKEIDAKRTAPKPAK
jgi:hypothetical protein